MPRLWNETIQAHRDAVRDAVLDATAALAVERGLTSLTMSQIAEVTGIGRATLYKYFPDVESILVAWHERQIAGHLRQLSEVKDRAGTANERLQVVLQTYALMSWRHRGSDLAELLHRADRIAPAKRQLYDLVRDLVAECARAGDVREDVGPDELAAYCLHALAAARGLASESAVRRLVMVTLAGLRSDA